jgi:hypothetical protein
VVVILIGSVFQVRAEGTVAEGTEEAFLEALAGGGTVLFEESCGITLTAPILIEMDTVINAQSHAVVISGGEEMPVFEVAPGVSLVLVGLTITDGMATNGGALYINEDATAVLTNCTFAGNSTLGADGTNGVDGRVDPDFGQDGGNGSAGENCKGGAIYNLGSLTAFECRFLTNAAAGGNGGDGGDGGSGSIEGGNGGRGGAGGSALGGGVYSEGSAIFLRCTFAGNSATGGSGGLGGANGSGILASYAGSGGQGASGAGAGVYSLGPLEAYGCTFSANVATGGDSAPAGTDSSSGNGSDGSAGGFALGGGLCSLGTNVLVNSTFFTNRTVAGDGGDGGPGGAIGGDGGAGGTAAGGGFYSSGRCYVTNCTFSMSGAWGGTGGAAGSAPYPGSTGSKGPFRGGNIANLGPLFVLKNSILSTNLAGTNGYGVITDAGHNISSDSSLPFSGTSRKNTDPRLGAFGENGGPTRTIALQPDSPALDAAAPAAAPAFDQRGVPRPVGAAPDIGAFEFGFLLSGHVTAGTNGIPGVRVAVGTNAVFTGDSGEYASGLLPGEQVITPSLSGYEFTPTSRTLAVTSHTNADFSALRVYAIEGRVTLDGIGMSNVTITAASRSTMTDTNGGFRLAAPAGAYSVAPSLSDYQFSPPSWAVNLGPDTNGLAFAAIAVFNIGGKVLEGTNGLANVRIALDGTNVTTSGSGGFYNIAGVRAGPHAVSASSACYHFVVSSIPITVGPGTNGVDFAAIHDAYTLRGRLTAAGGGLANATVAAGGKLATTDVQGYYAISNLCAGMVTVLPSLGCYRFNPALQSFALAGDMSGVDFSATPGFIISGRIGQGSAGLAGAIVQAGTNSALTDAQGNYTISSACPGTYAVIPSLGCVSFDPATRLVTVGPDASAVDFVAFSNNIFTVRGRVTDGTNGLAGVTVQTGTRAGVTDSTGNYSISQVCPGACTVTPMLTDFGFIPTNRSLTISADVNSVDFVAVPVYSIGGRIVQGTNGVPGVTVTADTGQSAITDTNGNYLIGGLRGGTNSVTPVLACYRFSPASLSIVLGPSTNSANFAATPDLHVLSGRITEGGVPLAGVTVQAGDHATNTDLAGNFVLAGLCPGTYTVTPSASCYKFNPAFRSVTVGPDNTNADFIAYRNLFTVRGRVTDARTAAGIGGVRLTFGGPEVLTDGSGTFVLSGLCPGAYCVVPFLSGYKFQPDGIDLSVAADMVGINFAGFPTLAVAPGTNGSAQVTFAVSPGVSGHLAASTNLASWHSLLVTNNFSTNTLLVVLTDASFASGAVRYYRVSEFPLLSLDRMTNGLPALRFAATPGKTYDLESSGNLLGWTSILTTNSPAAGTVFLRCPDPAAASNRLRFYRVTRD